MIYSLPYVLSFCVPIGILIASIMLYGRLAQDNELTAIKSAGINSIVLFKPVVIVVLIISFLMIFFNGYILPEAIYRARNLLTDIAQKKPSIRVYEGVFLEDFPNYTIYIGSIDDRTGKISDVIIWEKNNDQQQPTLIKSKSGRLSTSSDERYIILELDSGEISELVGPDKYRHLYFNAHQINLLVDDEFTRRHRKYRTDREINLIDLYHKTKNINGDIKSIKNQLVELKKKPKSDIIKFQLEDNLTKLRYKQKEFNQFAVEIEKKYALAFSCLIFLFFGANLGILIKRSGLGVGFIVGLLLFAVYYILLIAGEELADTAKINPFLGIWFGNILLTLITIELIIRICF
ncbi:MAG: LptF/LptG family permease, partial [candidate division WOR-3 bacterium]|nr:LptF/LptG family permease [candidate division WOR-3 bacterium]